MASRTARIVGWTAAGVLIAASAGSYLLIRSRDRLPAPDSPAYEDVVRKFYRGLASLDVGLLDDAKRDFTQAIDVVATEPASWANLGLAHLRLGEFDAASVAVERAATLAPASSEVAYLQGQL